MLGQSFGLSFCRRAAPAWRVPPEAGCARPWLADLVLEACEHPFKRRHGQVELSVEPIALAGDVVGDPPVR